MEHLGSKNEPLTLNSNGNIYYTWGTGVKKLIKDGELNIEGALLKQLIATFKKHPELKEEFKNLINN